MRRADIEVPNLTVAVSAWVRSACYPRGNLYPISHGAPTRVRRITRPDFRLCSRGLSRSQAPLCSCALLAGFPTRLREPWDASVTFWEATAPVKLPAWHGPGRAFHTRRLDAQIRQGGIPLSRVTPLPPILYRRIRAAMPGCSKAPRGLSVLSWVTGIFTGITISPSLPLRQRPSRYAFRAGRNLPDKEFRYLRTVIVTAAIHQGFSSKLPPYGLTSPVNLLALGRCQPLYIALRLSRDLCFW